MRSIGLLLLICSTLAAGDRVPFRVTCRPVFTPNACLPVESKPRCVSIDGVDYDLDPLLNEYRRAWTWPGNTEQSLRNHFATDHKTTGLDSLTFTELKKLHAVLHERELATKAKPAVTPPAPVRSGCPGGVCPSPSYQTPRRGMFFRWR